MGMIMGSANWVMTRPDGQLRDVEPKLAPGVRLKLRRAEAEIVG
ncbi:hypothetical protein [uncultured Lamprocystis sp.]|nr:hypothetical protein [uncultured Lamprocystis sp.]